MKKLLAIAMLMLMTIAASAKDIKTVVLTTNPQMHCEKCEAKIKENLKYVSGVKNIVTNVAAQTVTVTYDADKTSVGKIQSSLKKAKYVATVKNSANASTAKMQHHCDMACEKANKACEKACENGEKACGKDCDKCEKACCKEAKAGKVSPSAKQLNTKAPAKQLKQVKVVKKADVKKANKK